MTADDRRFEKNLMDSQEAVWDVARWFQSHGKTVTVNPTFIAPSHDQWQDYADGGDLFLVQRIEVKKLGVLFTCRDDWPFGDKFIVCAKHAWDRALQKPHAFIYLNQNKTHAAIVKGETHKTWTHEKRTDKRYDRMTQEFYFCDLSHVAFMPFQIKTPQNSRA